MSNILSLDIVQDLNNNVLTAKDLVYLLYQENDASLILPILKLLNSKPESEMRFLDQLGEMIVSRAICVYFLDCQKKNILPVEFIKLESILNSTKHRMLEPTCKIPIKIEQN